MSKITFEALSKSHISQGWLSWVNTYDPSKFTEFTRIPPNIEALEKIIDSQTDNELWLAALMCDSEKTDCQPVYFANIHISNISWIDRRCTFGRLIGNANMRGRGLGSTLTKEIIKYCFCTLGMQKVTAGCLETNIAAIKSNLKAGMIEEAILKKDRFVNGKFVDTHIFAAWANSWSYEDN